MNDKIEKTAFIMVSDFCPDKSADDIRKWRENHKSENDLAHAFAFVSNKAWLVEDNEYDYDEGTKEYENAVAISDAWFTLMDELEEEIFVILRKEGVSIPNKWRILVLAPFMKRHGFSDHDGWWIPD
ncbi:MAG: hypothetical protein ACI4M3_01425 [Acutalibacteraceae bacterium]